MMYHYRITIVRWVDGDTLDGLVDLGFGINTKIRFRLLDVDTPERKETNFKEAQELSMSVYPVGTTVEAAVLKGTDKYGRWLLSLPAVNSALIKAKLTKADNASRQL